MSIETKDCFNLEIATLEQKEKIEEVENLNVGARQRAELILVLLGVKQATDISIYRWNDPPEKVYDALVNKTRLCLSEKKRKRSHPNLLAEYTAALDQATADAGAELYPDKDHCAFGKLMNYPDSAIDAFVTSKLLPCEQYPDMSGIIFTFSLSNNHWQ